jgi:hypothetical protein
MSMSMLMSAFWSCRTLAESCTYSCLPDGLPAPATPTHTKMPCVLENAINAATETHLRIECLEVRSLSGQMGPALRLPNHHHIRTASCTLRFPPPRPSFPLSVPPFSSPFHLQFVVVRVQVRLVVVSKGLPGHAPQPGRHVQAFRHRLGGHEVHRSLSSSGAGGQWSGPGREGKGEQHAAPFTPRSYRIPSGFPLPPPHCDWRPYRFGLRCTGPRVPTSLLISICEKSALCFYRSRAPASTSWLDPLTTVPAPTHPVSTVLGCLGLYCMGPPLRPLPGVGFLIPSPALH